LITSDFSHFAYFPARRRSFKQRLCGASVSPVWLFSTLQMTPKKARAAPTRSKKTPVPKARRRYTEGNPAPCSAEKRGASAKIVVTPKALSSPAPSPESSTPINKKQVACRKWFDQAYSTGLRGIRREFLEKVKKFTPDLSITAFNEEANASKNRYDDVYLLDKSRVKIRISPENDDYIHASKVEVHPSLSYICTQGPLLNTITQFWLMCIQEESKVILQLCLNVEDEKEKCCDYMPKEIEEWATYGPVQVKITSTGAAQAMKKVTKTMVQCKFDGKETTITHLLYFGWPDHSVPESVPTCREVRTLVHKICEKKPVILHCSAGIGRTGTFVAIDMVCQKLLIEHNGDFSMIELIHDLRKRRMNAVQNDQQYSFIYRAVIEILIAEDALPRSAEVNQFIQSYEDLVMRKKKNKRPTKVTSNRTLDHGAE